VIDAPGPVARQLAAYNAQDVAGFAACYTDDVVLEDAVTGPFARGLDELRARYAALFKAHPENRASVLNRSVVLPWVFEEELVHRGGTEIRVLVVYRVQGEKISRATFFRG
jgi:hypothetical protein